jgi:thymidylate kinase
MKIIYLSGIDGCGKTTQAKLLVDRLRLKGVDANYLWLRWEPSFRSFIKAFRAVKERPVTENKQLVENENAEQKDWLKFKRRILANQFLRMLWLLYACGDYYFSYKKRFKKLTADVVVIDRYVNDFIIDQAVNLDIAPDATGIISDNFFLKKFHFPDFNIIIDLPALEGYTRKSDGTPLSYLETREKYYQALTGNETLHLNGLNGIDDLAAQIAVWVADKLEVGKI